MALALRGLAFRDMDTSLKPPGAPVEPEQSLR